MSYIYNQTEHFAWLPMLVNTWRPQGTKAIIWLQKYKVVNDSSRNRVNYKCTDRLGKFSYEFWHP